MLIEYNNKENLQFVIIAGAVNWVATCNLLDIPKCHPFACVACCLFEESVFNCLSMVAKIQR